jgi:hypothetical protein
VRTSDTRTRLDGHPLPGKWLILLYWRIASDCFDMYLLENQVGGQDYPAANVGAFLLGKLITQQILGEAQQRKQAQNNDNNIAQNYLNERWKEIVFSGNSTAFYRRFPYKMND